MTTTPAPTRSVPAQDPPPTPRGPLTPVEVATVGILSGLAVVLGLLSATMPFLNSALIALSALPVAMVSVRLRPRAAISAVAVTVLVSLAMGGVLTVWNVAQGALAGAIVGALLRRGVGLLGAGVAGALVGGVFGALIDALLWLFADLRDLALESVRVSATGYFRLIAHIPGLGTSMDALTHALEWVLAWWWVWVPASVLVGTVLIFVFAHWALRIVLARLQLASAWDPLVPPSGQDASAGVGPQASASERRSATPCPLPTRLDHVSYRYPGATADALHDVSAAFEAGTFTVVTGANGSGKSTLALLLAGAEPTSGTVMRPGPAGLGLPGGTALLAQRSELQMLGETVTEDLLWGLSPAQRDDVDVEDLLALVGLSGQAQALTRHLSGGQLQRLALAGALVRHPALLVSDESTAMVDAAGRRDLVAVMARLPGRGTAVVHITHDPTEATGADRIVRLDSGRIVFDGPPAADPDAWAGTRGAGAPTPSSTTPDEGGRVATGQGGTGTPGWIPSGAPGAPWQREHLWADRVSLTYDAGTPWANTVLHDVTLIASPGSATLVTGGNGSGKSTMSRILTGLMAPTAGRCTLGGEPMTRRVGEVALSMQFARLQLQRPSVRTDILAAARASDLHGREADDLVRSAMESVGLEWDLQRRGIDQLSGGQMRRVALAGLLASHPQVLVLDEPLAGLDQESRSLLISALEAHRRRGMAVIVISHDTDGLDALCDRRFTLAQGVLA